MEQTPTDWEKIFEDEDADRTAVIVIQLNLSDAKFKEIVDSQQYGAIETTRHGQTGGKSFLVIQFKDATSARNLIAKRCITMWYNIFTVIPFQSYDELIETIGDMTFTHPPYNTTTQPQRSDDNILNVLNDDCLGEVFRRMYPWDRIRMKNVCSRFKRVAEKAFFSVYQKNNIWLSHLNPDGNPISEKAFDLVSKKNNVWWGRLNPDGNLTLTEIEKFLRRYGPSINSMSFYDRDYEHIADGLNSIFKFVAKYCPNIKKLHLFMSDSNATGVGVDSQTLIEIRPLLSKLSDFTMGYRSLRICNEFIEAFEEIENLMLMVSDVDSVLPKMKFPKLKSCHITDIEGNGVLDGFLTQNPQIECLKIPYVTGVIRLISDKVPNLRELDLSHPPEPFSIDDCLCFNSLKKANISIITSVPDRILGESRENLFKIKNITSLTLQFGNLREFFDSNVLIEVTKHLWKLEKLHIDSRLQPKLSKDLIKEMLRHANQLTELHVTRFKAEQFREQDFFFREQDYNDILHIVKNRSNQIGLNIKISNHCRQLGKHGIKTFILNKDPRRLTIVSCFDSSI